MLVKKFIYKKLFYNNQSKSFFTLIFKQSEKSPWYIPKPQKKQDPVPRFFNPFQYSILSFAETPRAPVPYNGHHRLQTSYLPWR